LDSRKSWAKYVRGILSRSHSLDTERQVKTAVEHGQLPDGRQWLDWWKAWEPHFTVNQKAVWHDDTALTLCAKWAKQGPGIVWVEHSFFGRELSRLTGLDYYGEEGLNGKGQPIEAASPKGSVIASARANSTGRNLQAWARNLVTSPPTGAPAWEQKLGRTHRDGQQADTVTVDVLMGVREHWDAFDRALDAAKATAQTMGQSQKLLLADVVMPTEAEVNRWAAISPRWCKTRKEQ
jgi:hypothetical protein